MGRLDRLRRKKKHRKHRGKEHERRPRAAGSDPEPSGTPFLGAEEQDTSCTNSCDDTLSLHGPTLPDFQRPLGEKNQEEGHPSHHDAASDAMEVTRRLSCLNFSMLPPNPSSGYVGTVTSQRREAQPEVEVLSDLELFSEMTSAIQLPMLSDQGVEGMEGVESYHRQARKRPSRRKTNRRSKKVRYISTRDVPSATRMHKAVVTMATVQPLPLGVARTSSRETPGSPHGGGVAWKEGGDTEHMLSRARSFRRGKRSQQNLDDDPLQCCFSDTSVVLERDTSPVLALGSSPEEGDMFETTPPAMEDLEAYPELMCDDTLQSELSETTSDRYVNWAQNLCL